MCRRMVFAGRCPLCGNTFTWDHLEQQLHCLEAKNNGIFGHCQTDVHVDQHALDQECERCLQGASNDADGDQRYGGAGGGGGGGNSNKKARK